MQPERPELKLLVRVGKLPTAEELRAIHRNKVDSLVMENPPSEEPSAILQHFRDLHTIGEQDINAVLTAYHELSTIYQQEKWLSEEARQANRSLYLQNQKLLELYQKFLNGDKIAQIIIERLSDLANKDQLTGLLNRRGFEQVVENCQRGGVSGVLVMVDLDKFKAVNDAYGHHVGDLALMAAANYLNKIAGSMGVVTKMRSSKILGEKGTRIHNDKTQADNQPQVGRMGGEELAIFIPNMSAEQFEKILKQKSGSNDVARIRAPLGFKFSEMPVLEGKERPDRPDDYVSFSGGIIDLKPNIRLSEALAKIDKTLYMAKAGGRDRVLIAE